MSKKLLVLLAALSLTAHLGSAQSTQRPQPATAPADSTPTPEKRGFLKRVFGKKEAATPVPVATPEPKPTPRTYRRPRVTAPPPPSNENATDESKKPAPPKGDSEKQPETAPGEPVEKKDPSESEKSSSEEPVKPMTGTSKRGKKPAVAPPKKVTAQPPEGADVEEQEKWKYNEAKKVALEDSDVADLKKKADATLSDEEGRKALRAYNRALFNKMRKTDPTIKERIDRIEASVMKRLGGAE